MEGDRTKPATEALAIASNAHSFRMTAEGGYQRKENGSRQWCDLHIIRDQSHSPQWVWVPSKESKQ